MFSVHGVFICLSYVYKHSYDVTMVCLFISFFLNYIDVSTDPQWLWDTLYVKNIQTIRKDIYFLNIWYIVSLKSFCIKSPFKCMLIVPCYSVTTPCSLSLSRRMRPFYWLIILRLQAWLAAESRFNIITGFTINFYFYMHIHTNTHTLYLSSCWLSILHAHSLSLSLFIYIYIFIYL